jgi:triphosphatase
METELKLTIAAKDITALKAHPLLAGQGAPYELQQLDVYYDTPGRALWQRGYAFRVRAAGGNYVQAMKDAGTAVGGLHVRGEWESALDDGKPDPAALAAKVHGHKEAAALLRTEAGTQLLPIFTSSTARTIWDLRPADGCEVECVLDVATIRCGKRHVNIAEIELELKRGEPAQLFALAQELNKTLALRMENQNKAERGYALLDGARPPGPVKARPVALSAKATLDDALQRILGNCLEQMDANVPGVLAQDAECLHQMRVGLRRLRAALDLFKSKVHLPDTLQADLDWLAALLGKARDWDVFMTATLDQVGGAGWDADRDVLRGGAEGHAAAARKAVHAALHTRRYMGLVLGLSGWIAGRQWRQPADGVQPGRLDRNVRRAMRPLLDKAQRHLHKRLRKADSSDAASLHHVRIAAKKARYAAEFFQSLLPGKPLKKRVRRLTALQDVLGGLNDMAIANGLLDQLDHGPATPVRQVAFARGYLAASEAARIKALRKPFKRAATLQAAM